MVFSSVCQELESPLEPCKHSWIIMEVTSAWADHAKDSLGGVHCVGVKTKARSQLESIHSFSPCQDQFLFMFAYSLWGHKSDCNLTLIVNAPRCTQGKHVVLPSAGGHLGLYIRKAKEHNCGLGCFLEIAPTKVKTCPPFHCCIFFWAFSSRYQFPPNVSFQVISGQCPRNKLLSALRYIHKYSVKFSVLSPSNARCWWVAKISGNYWRITSSWIL